MSGAPSVASCPSCHRPVAVVRATCVYCGASLPETLPERLEHGGLAEPAASEPPVASASRLLLVLDVEATPVEAMGRGLGLSSYEADLLGRRGGYHLHRILEEDPAENEAERLRSDGVVVGHRAGVGGPGEAPAGHRGRVRLGLPVAAHGGGAGDAAATGSPDHRPGAHRPAVSTGLPAATRSRSRPWTRAFGFISTDGPTRGRWRSTAPTSSSASPSPGPRASSWRPGSRR